MRDGACRCKDAGNCTGPTLGVAWGGRLEVLGSRVREEWAKIPEDDRKVCVCGGGSMAASQGTAEKPAVAQQISRIFTSSHVLWLSHRRNTCPRTPSVTPDRGGNQKWKQWTLLCAMASSPGIPWGMQ